MATSITIDIYSGRPNPKLILSQEEEKELLQRFTAGGDKLTRQERAATTAFSRLGYRGLLVERDEVSGRGLPPLCRIYQGRAYTPEKLWPPTKPRFDELRFLQTLRPKSTAVAEAIEVRDAVTKPKKRQKPWQAPYTAPPGPSGPGDFLGVYGTGEGKVYFPTHPFWDAKWWWKNGYATRSNNCYNYACNIRTNSYAQPGRSAGAVFTRIDAEELIRAAMADGLTVLGPITFPTPIPVPMDMSGGSVVSLHFSRVPGDFHWLRLDRDGRWSHKVGGTPVTTLDNTDSIILDPRNADLGTYTEFVGFMIVVHGRVCIR